LRLSKSTKRRQATRDCFAFESKDGSKKSYINERLLSAANYAVDIDALGSSKEHKQDFATLFWKP